MKTRSRDDRTPSTGLHSATLVHTAPRHHCDEGQRLRFRSSPNVICIRIVFVVCLKQPMQFCVLSMSDRLRSSESRSRRSSKQQTKQFEGALCRCWTVLLDTVCGEGMLGGCCASSLRLVSQRDVFERTQSTMGITAPAATLMYTATWPSSRCLLKRALSHSFIQIQWWNIEFCGVFDDGLLGPDGLAFKCAMCKSAFADVCIRLWRRVCCGIRWRACVV